MDGKMGGILERAMKAIIFRNYWIGGLFLVGFISAAPLITAAAAESLADQVIIRRDSYGLPHIHAKTEEAAAFGLGYAQAEDHCVEIARRYIAARGESAKYLGTGTDGDFLMKLYDNLETSRRNLSRVSPLYRMLMNAFAAGINRFVEQHRKELPDWVPVFTAVDVMAHGRAGLILNEYSQSTVKELQKKYPAAGAAQPLTAEILSAEDSTDNASYWDGIEVPGSNAFALAGSRTTSGKPILLGNPHLNWNSLYWEAQVTVPGKINFFGSTLAGIPVLRAGFNAHLGWVTTNNAPDLTDAFTLRLDPGKPDHYLFRGKSLPLKKREISVEIRSPDGTLRTENRVYWESHLGKILYRTSDKAFAVHSTAGDAFRYYEGFYLLSRTRNIKEFLSIMNRNYIPTSNFTYADVEGNILYQWNARVPKRLDDGTSYELDVPGDTDKYVWKKLVKFARLPRLLNPSGGYIQNCNNPPWYVSLRNPIDSKSYPSYLELVRDLALRPQMALEMLESRDNFSLEDVKRLKFNTRMLLADRVKPDLLQALRRAVNPSEELASGLSLLEAWDNQVSAQSKGGVPFQHFWDTYSAAKAQPFAIPWDAKNPAKTPYGLADSALAVKHFEEAVRWTRQNYGTEAVAWGEVHRFRFGALDLPGDGASGSYGLVRVLRFSQAQDGKRVAGQIKTDEPPVGFGDAWVLAVEFTKPIVAYSVLAYGETTRSSSKHSSDQIRLFAEHSYKRVWFSEEDIKSHLEREYHP